MDSLKTYTIIMAPRAQELLDEYLFYILTEYQDPGTVDRVSNDALKTIDTLKNVAGSLSFLQDPELRSMGYRKINFLYHDYVMIYRGEENEDAARIVAVYHQTQDYEKIFAKELGIK